MTDDSVMCEVRLGGRDLASEMAAWLTDEGATEVTLVRERGIVDLQTLEYVISALFGIAGLAQVALWVRDKTGCRTIYDVRHKRILTEVDCRIRDGKIVIFAKGGKITIHDPDKLVDFDRVIQTAIKSGANVATKAISAGQASFEEE
jgi:hypothetical protein